MTAEKVSGENPEGLKEKDDHVSGKKLTHAERAELRELMKAKLNAIEEGEPTFDVAPYLSKKVEIEDVTMDTGDYGDMIRAETETLGYYETDEGKNRIRASVLFSVYVEKNEKGEQIIKFRPNSKLAKFMKRHKLEYVGDLIGCQVTTTLRATDKGDFISFI